MLSAAIVRLLEARSQTFSEPPTIVPLRDAVAGTNSEKMLEKMSMEEIVSLALSQYRKTLSPEKRRLVEQYRGVDIGMKVVGVGSVGTLALFVVMEGVGNDDPLVLQVKQAQESVLERFCGKSPFKEHGQRVVEGQRAMQTVSDMLLGWCRLPSEDGKTRDFYVRQLWDGKGSLDLTTIDTKHLKALASVCGWTLAHAHARTGDRFAIAGYLGETDAFDRAILTFARAYADQNEADYTRFMEALAAGELK